VSDAPLDVVGPAPVVEEARRWVAPDAPVRFHPVAPGDAVEVAGFRVLALPAAHRVLVAGDAVLLDVTDDDGSRLLWACDTGPWEPAWVEAVRGAAYDVALVEETFGHRDDLGSGHLHLASFGRLLEQLRDVGALTDETKVRAVHLSHHNPPEPDLAAALAAVGARPGRDGETLSTPLVAGDNVR
jgi:adenosylcobinamide kinase/adenosylcobinamide-phosphate guanylyltransferase